MKEGTPLTVAQLIAKLAVLPPDLPVHTEGCDCHGPAADVEVDEDYPRADYTRGPAALITRS
jgi:hypothetical protein